MFKIDIISREVKMSELISCDTPFIGRNETLDLSRYLGEIADQAAASWSLLKSLAILDFSESHFDKSLM